ncbi:MAG: FG-GAP repeat protein [Verrucomicrobia bacterium]|nr:FG-GAP repeat protein [Verrucomicrobiota bacterium]
MRHCISHRLGVLLVLALAGVPFALADGATTRNVPTALYPTIQSAIIASTNGDTVVVADGVYSGVGNRSINFFGRDITVHSANGPANCTIDAGGLGRVFVFASGETDEAVVEGFTIINGDSTGQGGAFSIANSSPTIRDCIIYNCEASSSGGALALVACNSVFENCVIVGNESLYNEGGAISCTVSSAPVFVNCTFADNRASAGGALYALDSNPTFINCILYNNIPDETSLNGSAAPTFDYCDIEGGWLGAGTGNVDEDPTFTNPGMWDNGTFANGDYTALPASPVIDAGLGDGGVTVPAQDILGNDRVDDPTTTNTGVGTPDYVDLGAYEFQSAPPEPVSYADIVWRETTTGQIGVWLMHGMALVSGGVTGTVAPASGWVIQGVGDFDGDGRADILWRNTLTGDVAIWIMNGITLVGGTVVQNVPLAASWEIEGVGDFNNNGKDDILWRNTGTGAVAIWLMNGTMLVGGYAVATVDPATNDYEIQAVGDFSGDGRADILWRETTTNEIAIWLMNGTTRGLANVIGTVAAAWVIEGVGDFNNNGKDDILWRNSVTGAVGIWLMNGLTIVSTGTVATVDPAANDYDIQGVGDFSGDGRADILWRETTTGHVAIWIMNGLVRTSAGVVAVVDPTANDWEIRGVGDFNGAE